MRTGKKDHLFTDRDFCCPTPLAAKSIWSGSNLSWILCNLISSWADAKYLVWWLHLLCYFPSFALGLGIGYVWAKTAMRPFRVPNSFRWDGVIMQLVSSRWTSHREAHNSSVFSLTIFITFS